MTPEGLKREGVNNSPIQKSKPIGVWVSERVVILSPSHNPSIGVLGRTFNLTIKSRGIHCLYHYMECYIVFCVQYVGVKMPIVCIISIRYTHTARRVCYNINLIDGLMTQLTF